MQLMQYPNRDAGGQYEEGKKAVKRSINRGSDCISCQTCTADTSLPFRLRTQLPGRRAPEHATYQDKVWASPESLMLPKSPPLP